MCSLKKEIAINEWQVRLAADFHEKQSPDNIFKELKENKHQLRN